MEGEHTPDRKEMTRGKWGQSNHRLWTVNVCIDHVLPIGWPTDFKWLCKRTWVLHCIFLFSPYHTASVLVWEPTMCSSHQCVPVYHSPCCCPQAPHCLVSTSCTEDHRTGQIENASHATDSGSNTAYSVGLKKFFFHLFKVWCIKTCSFSRGKGIRKSHSWHEHFSQRSSASKMPLVTALLKPWKFFF